MSALDYVHWLRARVGQRKIVLPYTSAIIADADGRLLLQRRSDFDWWGLPGGALEPGERLSECLMREVREETGLHVVPERLVGLYSSPDFDITYPNGDQVQQFTACFACRTVSGTLQPDGDEIVHLDHCSPDQLPDVPPWYRAMIEDWAAGHSECSFRRGRPGQADRSASFLSLRPFIGHAPLILVGAGAFVQDDAGAVLLVQRADDGSWALPAGGMDIGERIDRTVVREMREETGLDVKAQRVIGVYSGPLFAHTYPNGDQIHIVTTLFACRVVGGSLQPDGNEIAAARFFPPTALPPLAPRQSLRIRAGLTGQRAAWI